MPVQQNLKAVVDFVCARRGLTPALVNAAALRSIEVQGYAIGNETGEDVINSLSGLFQCYKLDTGDLLTFNQLKNAPFAGLIEAAHVGFMGQDAESGGAILEHAKQDALPSSVELTFSDPARAYEQNTAIAKLQLVDSNEPRRMSTSAVIPFERARQVCDAALVSLWEAQTTTSVVVPVDYAHIDAGDVVEFDGSYWRVTRKLFSYPLAFKLDLSRFSYAPFGAVKATSVAPVVVSQPVERINPTLMPLDIQLVNQADYSGFYAVAYEPRGAIASKVANLFAKNADLSWTATATMVVGAKVGITAGMPAGAATTFDSALEVSVTLVSTGELLSCTFERALEGENRCLIGNEICAFTTATLVDSATATYLLKGLVRGLGGVAPGAVAGDRFVLLEKSFLASVPVPSGSTNKPLTYKLVGTDAPAALASEITFANSNQRLRPLPPVHLRAANGAGYTSKTLSWVRQARKNYEWLDEAETPLDFARERYELQLLDAGGAVVGAYTSENVSAMTVANVPGATQWRVRQLGDLLPGAWSQISEL